VTPGVKNTHILLSITLLFYLHFWRKFSDKILFDSPRFRGCVLSLCLFGCDVTENTVNRPHGHEHSPLWAIARMNYDLLPPGRTQNRTIARKHSNALLAFCITNLIHCRHTDVTEPIYRMYVKYAKLN